MVVVDYEGRRILSVDGNDMQVFGVGGGVFANWNCGGELTQVVRQSGDGHWVRVQSEPLRSQLDLLGVGLVRAALN